MIKLNLEWPTKGLVKANDRICIFVSISSIEPRISISNEIGASKGRMGEMERGFKRLEAGEHWWIWKIGQTDESGTFSM